MGRLHLLDKTNSVSLSNLLLVIGASDLIKDQTITVNDFLASLGLDSIALSSQVITATAHGLTAADEGKPIGRTSANAWVVWDDANNLQPSSPVSILRNVIDVNTIFISQCGQVVQIPDTLLPGGMPADSVEGNNSRYLYWDKSAVLYKHTKPTDSRAEVEIIYWIGASQIGGMSDCICLVPGIHGSSW